MKIFQSLKYRIAITIFLLEAILLSFVLWHTQSTALQQAKTQIETQDNVILDLLSEASYRALVTLEFETLQPFVSQAATSLHVLRIIVTDYRNIVVVSSNKTLAGSQFSPPEAHDNTYWLQQTFETGGSHYGDLYIEFSQQELNQAYETNLTKGFSIALVGMLIIAIFGILFGHLLTKRLEKIIAQTSSYAKGEAIDHFDESGKDELAVLAKSLNHLVDQVNHSMREMEHMAYHDPLTGLANRRNYETHLLQALESAQKLERTHCLMQIDLDYFKKVNDRFGHDAGDQLLVELTQRLSHKLRKEDTFVRLGGDEFAVLIENANTVDMQHLADKLRHEVETFSLPWGNEEITIGASIGVVMISQQHISIQQLMRLADIACYIAKENGRNNVHFYDASNDPDHSARLRLEN